MFILTSSDILKCIWSPRTTKSIVLQAQILIFILLKREIVSICLTNGYMLQSMRINNLHLSTRFIIIFLSLSLSVLSLSELVVFKTSLISRETMSLCFFFFFFLENEAIYFTFSFFFWMNVRIIMQHEPCTFYDIGIDIYTGKKMKETQTFLRNF